MDELSSPASIVAAVACVLAVIALVLVVLQARAIKRLRADQQAVLGEGSEQDLVTHAARLQDEFVALSSFVQDAAQRLETRMGVAEGRLDGSISAVGLVRYDAYNEMSGRQSTSIALIDDQSSGVVLSSIHHRDQARLYAKQLVGGTAELTLSPEELEAVGLAQRGHMQDAP